MKEVVVIIVALTLLVSCTGSSESIAPGEARSHMGLVSKSISVNGLNFRYVEKGSGEVMLFLHGFPYFSESWYKLMHEFGDQYHVIAPDNRGYGFSDKPENVSDYKVQKLVSDVVELINQLSPQKNVVLVGHDWGAGLAWVTAQLHPELVSKLIIINGVAPNVFLNALEKSPAQRQKSSYVHKLDGIVARLIFSIKGPELIWDGISRLHKNGHVDDKFKHAFFEAWGQSGAARSAVNWYIANIPEFDNIQNDDYWPAGNNNVKVPTLLIWSKDDPAFTKDIFDAIPNYIDDLTINVINTGSHAPFLDHSEEVIKHMQTFLGAPTKK